MLFARAIRSHADPPRTMLLSGTEYECRCCGRRFLGRDAARDALGNYERCPSAGCAASGLGVDLFECDDDRDDVWCCEGPDDDEWRLRDELLGIAPGEVHEAVSRFDSLTLGRLASLLELRFVDVDATRPDAPDVTALVRFLCRWPEATLHGYALHPSKNFAGGAVRLEGVACELGSLRPDRREALRAAFVEFSAGADVVIEGPELLSATWGAWPLS